MLLWNRFRSDDTDDERTRLLSLQAIRDSFLMVLGLLGVMGVIAFMIYPNISPYVTSPMTLFIGVVAVIFIIFVSAGIIYGISLYRRGGQIQWRRYSATIGAVLFSELCVMSLLSLLTFLHVIPSIWFIIGFVILVSDSGIYGITALSLFLRSRFFPS